MASAEALFARHWKQWGKLVEQTGTTGRDLLAIFSACIIAEAIRQDFEEAKSEAREPHIDI